MIDEQKLRELAARVSQLANLEANELAQVMDDSTAAILALLDELATLRQERTAWRVTAENAEAELKIVNEMNDQLREQNTAVDEACAKLEAEADRVSRDVPAVGSGHAFSARLKIAADGAIFANGGGVINCDSAARKELFALIDHVCIALDSPPASPQPQPVQTIDRSGCAAGTDEECTRHGCANSCPATKQPQPVQAQPSELGLLRELIADDSKACTFQSLGQYRSWLLKTLAEQAKKDE